MTQLIQGKLDATGRRFGLVVARFNEFITRRLAEGAIDAIVRHGGSADDIVGVWVPGSFEVPIAAQKLAQSGRVDAVICIGCLIRGETIHFDLIAHEATRGIGQVSLATGVPVTLGIITVDNLEQAIDRAGGKHGNKGADAALAAIELVSTLASVGKSKPQARSGRS